MALEYISYIKTEKLFASWQVIQAIKESLQLEIKAMETKNAMATAEEYIDTLTMGNKVAGDMPHSSKISDATCDIAASYRQVMRRDYINAYNQITDEKYCIDLVDDKLGLAFRRLSPAQQKILKLFYWEKKTWAEVLTVLKEEKHFLSKNQAQSQRRIGIEKMTSISMITTEMYDRVIKLVEVE